MRGLFTAVKGSEVRDEAPVKPQNDFYYDSAAGRWRQRGTEDQEEDLAVVVLLPSWRCTHSKILLFLCMVCVLPSMFISIAHPCCGTAVPQPCTVVSETTFWRGAQ